MPSICGRWRERIEESEDRKASSYPERTPAIAGSGFFAGARLGTGQRANQQVKPTIYIETTVVSYLTARPTRDVIVMARQQITMAWWRTKLFRFSPSSARPMNFHER
jgi:hypothetical protein